MAYHYATDAASLLEQCLQQLEEVIEADEKHSSTTALSYLYDLRESLIATERNLFLHFSKLLETELAYDARDSPMDSKLGGLNTDFYVRSLTLTTSFSSAIELVNHVLQEKQKQQPEIAQPLHMHLTSSRGNGDNSFVTYYPRRNAEDVLLFRLVVTLQLCLVRIDDARFVVMGQRKRAMHVQPGFRRKHDPRNSRTSCSTVSPYHQQANTNTANTDNSLSHMIVASSCFALGLAATAISSRDRLAGGIGRNEIRTFAGNAADVMTSLLPRLALAALTATVARRRWNRIWMNQKIVNSAVSLDDWNQQWQYFTKTSDARLQQQKQTQQRVQCSTNADVCDQPSSEKDGSSCAYLKHIQLMSQELHQRSQCFLFHSQGELRFLMLKRAMDVFYASVNAAMEVTRGENETTTGALSLNSTQWRLTLTTVAAASFYSLTGASRKAAEATSNSKSACQLIQNAWGVVSLPAIKNLSLQASRLLKGAAIADRIEICGVSCFVLSREPAPELAAAIQRFHRKRNNQLARRRRHRKSAVHSTLSTIHEETEHNPVACPAINGKPFARSSNNGSRYRQRDVIFHLTGGGFFAHIIASDLPFLLDWSAATGAVVICPEYALLPENRFPTALRQVADVYCALKLGHAAPTLGFETNRIVVTGESAGGNLAAALCVKIVMDYEHSLDETWDSDNYISSNPEDEHPPQPNLVLEDSSDYSQESGGDTDKKTKSLEEMTEPFQKAPGSVPPPLPDALMLSCAVLNLSLELSHSRILGVQDPVLPSGLISAISDAYLPNDLGINKKNPLASPYFASDSILSHFPPTLFFASSNDSLLDDSVGLNQRLRNLGVESELRATHNLPHAYLGLGTAGFPEAQQVQQECQEWLAYQFSREDRSCPDGYEYSKTAQQVLCGLGRRLQPSTTTKVAILKVVEK